MSSFALSAIIDAHTNDVRCVTPSSGGDGLITGSRDKTAKTWKRDAVNNVWSTETVYSGHTNFVSCLAVAPPSDDYQKGLIYTGSNDAKIRAFVPGSSEPDHVLEGHSATVSSLHVSKNQTLLSASWDTTLRVWLNKRTVMTLQGHEAAAWCGLIFSDIGLMVTGAADGYIKVWKAGQCKATIKAHGQAVRDMALLSRDEFVSCSNDGSILAWKVDATTFNATRTFSYEESDFIYSVYASDRLFVSSGENTGIKIFFDGKLNQSLAIPALSVWSVCILNNGDIAAGCSDNRVYVFSREESRRANPELMALFDAEVKSFLEPKSMETTSEGLPEEVAGVKVADMPGPEGLHVPGRRNGQTKMIKDGNTISVHEWSEADGKWTKVGDVVGQPKDSNPSGRGKDGGKVVFEGVEYDHVFNIDVDEGVVLKLPYNNGQDPFTVAQDFIHQHNLPQDYLEQIANFIVKNAGGPISWEKGSSCDPLTGGNAYVSGSGGVTASSFTKSSGDPFTGGSAYTTTNGNHSAEPDTVYFPQVEFVTFNQIPKMEALKSKLVEFNTKVQASVQLPDEAIDRLIKLGTCEDNEPSDAASLVKVLRWAPNVAFPGIDIVRLALVNKPICDAVLAKHADEILDILLQHISRPEPATNQMLALRALANLFSNDKGIERMVALKSTILERLSAMFPVANKQAQIALATVLLNYSVAMSASDDEGDGQSTCLNLSLLFVQGLTEPEAKFRNLVALGTLLKANASHKKAARDQDAKDKLEAAKLLDKTQKVADCANSIIGMLST